MKHPIDPPENLPIVPEVPMPTEEVPSQTGEPKDTMWQPGGAPDNGRPAASGPSQSSQAHMEHFAAFEFMDARAAAAFLAISVWSLYRLVAQRRIAHYRLPSGLRFVEADLKKWLADRRVDRLARPYGGS